MTALMDQPPAAGGSSDRSILDARDDPDRFRSLVRHWLAEAVSSQWRAEMSTADEQEQIAFQRRWFAKLSSIGMTTAHWPAAWGGEDLGIAQQIIFYEELARARAPNTSAFVISLNQVPATVFSAGTQEQKERLIGGVLAGDVWCQGFSEPNAGSDLAAIRTSAIRKNGVYVVNGQKIWTSNGHFAKYCLLLARTDPDSSRHSGLSLFALDMASQGITIRPIQQCTGQAEFNELFLDDVEIPAENLIGTEGQGWTISQSTLSAERGLIVFELAERFRCFVADILAEGRGGAEWWQDDQFRREFMRAYADAEALKLMTKSMLEHSAGEVAMAGQYVPMYVKLHYAQLLQRFGDLMVRIHGIEGQTMLSDVSTNGSPSGNWMFDYLSSWAWTIAGGTNEIIRNIIAERVLGLPR
jgi:alkylation response protein AidB-like acyl-CoA dehydrogenase